MFWLPSKPVKRVRKFAPFILTRPPDIEKEYYLAVLMDRATSKPVIIASTEGGMDIEEVAESSPENPQGSG